MKRRFWRVILADVHRLEVMLDPWKIDFGYQTLHKAFNGAVFMYRAEPNRGVFFREEVIRDALVQVRSQAAQYYNPISDFEVNEHALIKALGACREFRERKRITDQSGCLPSRNP